MFFQLIACPLFACSVGVQTNSTAQSAITAQTSGANQRSPESATFQLAAPGLSFALPSPFSVVSRAPIDKVLATKRDEAKGEDKTNLGCLQIPFVAAKKSAEGPVTFSVITFDLKCANATLSDKDLDDFAQGIVKGIGRSNRNQYLPPVHYQLAGDPAVLLRGTLYSGTGHPNQSFFACVLATSSVACFSVTTPTSAQLADLAATSLHLDSGSVERLVPEAAFSKVASEPAIDDPVQK